MAVTQPHTLSTSVLANIEHVLTSEANRIGSDIHKQTLHQSPWLDLIKKAHSHLEWVIKSVRWSMTVHFPLEQEQEALT